MIVGHQKEFNFLKKSFQQNRLAHALIFIGEESLGKKTLALEFIKFINCYQEEFSVRPCKKCASCEALKRGWHPDLVLVQESKNNIIPISEVQKLQYFLNQKAYYGGYKSVIIDNAEKMTKDAQSRLLKTLEEPKGKTIIILVSSFHHFIMKTIISRCQKIRFSSVAREDLEEFLENKKIIKEEREKLIFYSCGRPGKLINFINNPNALKKEEEDINTILSVLKKDLYVGFRYIKEMENNDIVPVQLIKSLIGYFRNILFAKTGGREKIDAKIGYSLPELEQALDFLNELQYLFSFTNINKKLALEMLILRLHHLKV